MVLFEKFGWYFESLKQCQPEKWWKLSIKKNYRKINEKWDNVIKNEKIYNKRIKINN